MNKALCLVAAVAVSTSAVSTTFATDLHLTVRVTTPMPVAGGATVDYEVTGLLSDTLNEGLALFGYDVTFAGGPLTQMSSSLAIRDNCDTPGGITNPAGFGGTTTVFGREGELVQVGCGQNTIKNFVDNAPFPISSTIMTLLGHTEIVLATGTLTAPVGEGDYPLTLTSGFANVIIQGETGLGTHWATESVGTVTFTNAVVTVGGNAGLLSSDPACGVSWPRSANNFAFLEFDADLPAPAAGQVQIRELLADGAFGADLSTGFTISIENNGGGLPRVLTIRENGTQLVDRKWYAVTDNGWTGVAAFEVDIVHLIGDEDGNGRVLSSDVVNINSSISFTLVTDSRRDIDGNNRVLSADVVDANGRIQFATVPKPTGHLCAP